jgi:hypothetical protein
MSESMDAAFTERPIRGRLAELRDTPRERWAATAVGALLGLALAWAHWLGLVVGGALVAFPAADLKRGLAAGFGFGLVTLAAVFLTAPAVSPGELLALTPAAYVTFGGGLVLPVLGSLVRGIV